MFRRNQDHLQAELFSTLDDLPAKLRSRLEESWAGTFYRECFVRLDERPFAVLYSEVDSRPNTPVNVLLAFEQLKAGYGWSDAETYDHFCFDLQVRYAVGLRNLDEGHFELRTVYNFRRRLLEHWQATGQDLFKQGFEQVTDKQLRALGLTTGRLRMDSTQVASNIRNFSRLQLLVEVLGRVWRMLSDEDRLRHVGLLGEYTRKSATQFVYGVSSEEGRRHIGRIGQVMEALVEALAEGYGQHPTYGLLRRVFEEQYLWEGGGWRPRKPEEISSQSLCAPDDPEATMRRKGGVAYKGYVSNVTETCDPDNPVQLIVQVQTAPNVRADSAFLEESAVGLKSRLGCDGLITDGAYNAERVYQLTEGLGIEHWQTGIQGHPSTRYLPLFHYRLRRTPGGEPMVMVCPHGQEGTVSASRRAGHYLARFDLEGCRGCPHAKRCLARAQRRHRSLGFSDYDLEIARRRKRIAEWEAQGRNPRAAVEGTVRALKCPFGAKLPVRGLFRVSMLMLGAAFMFNVRRIHRWAGRQRGPQTAGTVLGALSRIWNALLAQVRTVLRVHTLTCGAG